MIPAAAFCAIMFLASCPQNSDGYGDSINVVSVNARELIAPAYGEQDSAAKAVAAGANDFAFRLSAGLVKKAGNDNFVCSPYSAWLPLAALVNATNSQNKAALITALGASGISESDINRSASRMLYSLTNLQDKDGEDYHNPLKIANAIFIGNTVTLRQDFAQTFMDYFLGSSINVDFSSPSAVDAVNRWASNNTDGLIKDIIKEFDPETVAAIANAIYFSDRWEWEFRPGETKEGVFHAPAGNSTAFYMLREGDAQTYYEDSRIQATSLRFKNGGGLYVMLPKSLSAADLLASMTNKYFSDIQTNSVQATGKLLLPRFSI